MTKIARVALAAKKERAHERYVATTYGLAPGEYAALLAAQGGGCAICGNKPRKRRLAVDHDHVDQRVRALLCFFCNGAIGQFEYDQDTATRAARYLDRIALDHAMRPPPVDTSRPKRRAMPVPEGGDLPWD